ncbi:uncharacterized protein EI97DRAFT_237542 [Westerdykella ornata]|uniref:Uncharacterized protein n=1 Tax=Westerdykella ornata TaxID=318751 RepID=A0A6A6J775_WESOR|nr:uncharacterized protein EI97DRAFT_237542 [Westerdykella ornata]KAF2272047.1 hypothetical protein EI97DRAFT_237542 [Westerdykella ornata]
MMLILISLLIFLPTLLYILPRFLALYDTLREHPQPPTPGSLLSHIRYHLHKGYFRYLLDGPGYVLERSERLIFDTFVLVLLTAIGYGAFLAFKTLFGALAHVALDTWIQSGVSVDLWRRMGKKACRTHIQNPGADNASVEICRAGGTMATGRWIAEVRNEIAAGSGAGGGGAGGCSPFAIA